MDGIHGRRVLDAPTFGDVSIKVGTKLSTYVAPNRQEWSGVGRLL